MISANARAQQLFENINTAVLVFDANLCLIDINPSGESLLSISQRKASGSSAYEIFPISSRFVETIQRSLQTKHPYTEWGVELDFPGIKSITVDCMVTPLLEGENCQEVIVELVDAHSQNRVMKEQNLSALSNAARESLSGIAHEIKNPLGGLRGAAQLLEQELNGNELTEYTQIIINEADRLRNLVDSMLAPSSQRSIETLNIHEVLEYVHNLVVAELHSDIKIKRDYDPSLPDLKADREQLIQAVLNIFRNAAQAITPDGNIWVNTRIKRKFTIQQRHYKLAVQIEIIDDGPGISAEIGDSIFYPMVTGRAEGTGLGLSIAQSLIQLHGGTLEYERVKNRTIFRILLPLRNGNE